MPQAWRPTHPGDPPPKWGLSKAGRLVIAITVAVGVVIAFMIIAIRPAGASESLASPAMSQEPSPEPPPWFGGRVEMPEHGFALTLPLGWVAFDTRAEIDRQVEALLDGADPSTSALISPEGLLRMLAESQGEVVMLDLAGGPSDPSCSLSTIAPEPRLSEVAAEMYADLDPRPEVIYLDGPLWLPTDVGPSFSIEYYREVGSSDPQSVTTGMVSGDGFAILLTCTETAETAADDWMDIAATLELMPPGSSPPWFGERAEMPEHGFAVMLPDGWVGLDLTGDIDAQLEPVAAWHPDAQGEVLEMAPGLRDNAARGTTLSAWEAWGNGVCSVSVPPDLVPPPDDESRQGLAQALLSTGSYGDVEPPTKVDIPGGTGWLLRVEDDAGPMALMLAMNDAHLYLVGCATEAGSEDDWLSFIETFEFLPVEE